MSGAMKINAYILLIIISTNCFANADPRVEKINENNIERKQSEPNNDPLIKKLNDILITTAPFWVPFVTSCLIDYARATACDRICHRIVPEGTTIDCGVFHIKTKDALRIGLEAVSHSAVYAIFQGKFNNSSYQAALGNNNLESTCRLTANYIISRHLIPGLFNDINAIANSAPLPVRYEFEKTNVGHFLNRALKTAWQSYLYYPSAKAVLEAVRKNAGTHEHHSARV